MEKGNVTGDWGALENWGEWFSRALMLFPLCCMQSHFSCVQLCVTPWVVAHQAPLSMGFSRQEYWSG